MSVTLSESGREPRGWILAEMVRFGERVTGLICSICHREDIETGYDLEIRRVRATSLKQVKLPEANLILCDECYGHLDLTPHDVGSSAGIEPALDASEEQGASD